MSTYPHAALLLSAAHPSHFPPDAGAEVAFAGRSNAGKSSAINALTGRRSLARTAKTPGRTRLLNFFELLPGCRIVDLPGYGYAEASAAERASWAPMTTALAARASLRGLFLIVDSRRGLLEGDAALIAWAEAVHCPVHVLLSKTDKLRRTELRQALAAATAVLAGRATVQAFSAVDGTGLEQARRQLHHWLQTIKGPGG
ncbi:MAG: YihA family ribosome biogenesis GTP-binding protein [Gammaproteobacteria bacterium]|nr:YihA family ribosome biogenesis GTP-binding protein [Gammaproteobacteria bacterium]